MRADGVEAARQRGALIKKAQAEKKAAEKEARESRQQIIEDRDALEAAITKMRSRKERLETQSKALNEELINLNEEEAAVWTTLEDKRMVFKDLNGFLRARAKEMNALASHSHHSALTESPRPDFTEIADSEGFPGMEVIRAMGSLAIDEIRRSGEVRIVKGPFIDRGGQEAEGDILVLGNFSTAYRTADEAGFLIYSDTSRRLFALSKPPGRQIENNLNDYMSGQSEAVYIDISRGSALRQFAHRLSLKDRVRQGGPLVWPIIIIGVLATLIIMERLVTLSRKQLNAGHLMDHLTESIDKKDWEKCQSDCAEYGNKPISRVLAAGIDFHQNPREDMENALQEAILREIPPLERFLSTLGMLGAISPLMGLLGTVTGMINTFQSITLHGTSKPRLMAGGISEALVTTMLGLAVAIPILLSHSLLSRWAERQIGEMEEKAVAFVNYVSKRTKSS
jgi:biopolymer transport protein ExbB